MKRFVLAFLCVAFGAAIAATYVKCPGCIDRSRVNATCEWTADVRFEIDPTNPADYRHLAADAQLAEELAVRHADAEFKRLYGYEGHGGAVENGRVRNSCMARLVAEIERFHLITLADVQSARAERNRLFDTAVVLLFVPIYVLGAAFACRAVRSRVAPDVNAVQLTATALTSIVVGAAGLQIGQLWLSIWEIVRVGNGHISAFRAATRTAWVHEHAGAAFAAAVVLYGVVAALIQREAAADDRHDPDIAGPVGIVIR